MIRLSPYLYYTRKAILTTGNDAEPLWVWKDNKGGYEELLRKIGEPIHDSELKKYFQVEPSIVPAAKYVNFENQLSIPMDTKLITFNSNLSELGTSRIWYNDIATYLTNGSFPKTCTTKVQNAAFLRKASRYHIGSYGDLFIEVWEIKKRCIVQDEVSRILYEAHDNGGHFAKVITMKRLKDYYWPRLAIDVEDYIL
ncbi:hypothetical protein K3495_g12595 [Podosphaera aphanis]|nr:hypothetical protein K3495_g12595 [Podosphaera aphanis]